MGIFSYIFGENQNQHAKQDELTQKISATMQIALKFLMIAAGFLPGRFEKNMNTQQVAILFAFQAGAIVEACYMVSLSVDETVATCNEVLQILNNLTKERATEILRKVSDYMKHGYPPYEEGQKAFRDYVAAISNNSEEESLLAAKRLWILLEAFNDEK